MKATACVSPAKLLIEKTPINNSFFSIHILLLCLSFLINWYISDIYYDHMNFSLCEVDISHLYAKEKVSIAVLNLPEHKSLRSVT